MKYKNYLEDPVSRLKNIIVVNDDSMENNPLFSMVEKRYSLIIQPLMYSCHESETLNGYRQLIPDKIFYNRKPMKCKTAYFNSYKEFDARRFRFKTVDDIYKMTISGPYSYKNEFNAGKNPNSENFMKTIPVVNIVMNGLILAFRVDNMLINDILLDTELVLNGDKNRPELTIEEIELELADKLSYQMNCLKTLFKVKIKNKSIKSK